MKINQKKLARQVSIIDKWIANGCAGTLEAVTGFGKTFVIVLSIQRFHKKYPNYPIDIVVPTINLKDDWVKYGGHIQKHELQNVNVFVINTYTDFADNFRKPAILFLDEIHNYASDKFGRVFNVAGIPKFSERVPTSPFVFGFTATLERVDGKHSFIEEYCPIIDTVSSEEAKREGYVSNSKIYNLGLNFEGEELDQYNQYHDIFNSAFAKFNGNFELAMACCKGRNVVTTLVVPVKEIHSVNGNNVLIEKEKLLTLSSFDWILYVSRYNEWNGREDDAWSPKKVAEYAQQFSYTMRKRKEMIYNAKIKIETIVKIADKFPTSKIITFGQSNSFADALVQALGDDRCKSYHSDTKGTIIRTEVFNKKGGIEYKNKRVSAKNVKALILSDYRKKDSFQVLATSKALDEGLDNPYIRIGIQASYTSGRRQDVQRRGRTTRIDDEDEEKMALNINLYMKDTQEVKWLKDKQRGIKDVEWIDSVEEIVFEESEDNNFSLT